MSIAGSDFQLAGGGSGGGVTQLLAGTNISLSPAGGTGIVTVNDTAPANTVRVRKFPFTAATSGLFTPGTGWTFYTGTTGDLIHDCVLFVTTATGSTPALMDITTNMSAGLFGLYHYWCAAAVDVTTASAVVTAGINGNFTGLEGFQATSAITPRSLLGAGIQAGPVFSTNTGIGMPPIQFTANQPLIAYVTQTGVTTGAAVVTPGSFAGTIYLLTSTPA